MTLKQECKAWTVLATGALAIAGVFALLLVFSRTPGVQDILPWPWKSFFHKGLVTHVIFSFVVWFLATMGALWSYRLSDQKSSGLGKIAIGLAHLGCIGLILPALLDLGTAELNNYVPVMNHWLYYTGLVLLFIALALIALRQIVTTTGLDGYKVCAVLYLIALACFGLAYFYLPEGLTDPTYNERLFWGGGHVLQFVNTALLFLTWKVVVKNVELPARYLNTSLILLLIFALPAPVIYPFFDILGQIHRDFYTEMLRYGLILPSLIVSFCLFQVLLSKEAGKLDRLTQQALWLSLVTYNLGGLYGLMLDGTDTRVPAHYHAVIGGINLSFMIFYHRIILPFIDIQTKEGKIFKSQYWFYGLGQIMHASGMFLAGSQGVPRKTAGDAQSLDSIEKILSMGLMGVGGIVAVIGGVLFVVLTIRAMLKGGHKHETI
ncbi:cbb3-type cytochrome c oxidase subunit I [Terasakiella sp. A23]|uniref:cbb3-type cytochrome c oxidase subunit I n=1 Tax=Terasakiella sp. FCG-A23 TaxID=3080561 RepID=UPI0029530D55|nr:cbb3-type cytochrome c oxidase subunit I [Terasakiella sp. A23]MDV7338707.1 cbb3-type cytochrome c oxidase subunit I [Terasakiella sp. A23]